MWSVEMDEPEPRGRVTRGKTRPGRLAAVDEVMARLEPELLGSGGAVLDLGVGARAETTVEMARRLRRARPGLPVVGVEIDRGRLEAARAAHPAEDIEWVCGGFEVPAAREGPAAMVRAMNVLRGYDPRVCERAHAQIGEGLIEGGLLLEGSCDGPGARLGMYALRRRAGQLVREGLCLWTDFSRGFAPWMFRDWLPQDLRRGVEHTHPVMQFLLDWHRAWERARGGRAIEEGFVASARALARARPGVCVEPRWLERGYLWWRPPGGVPGRSCP